MLTFYVSSYGKNDDKGIYIVNLDEKTQKFSLVQHIVTQDYPSYMITKNNTLFLSYKNAGNLIFSFYIRCNSLTSQTLDNLLTDMDKLALYISSNPCFSNLI